MQSPDPEIRKSPFLGSSHDHLDNFDDFLNHLNRAAHSVLPRVSRRHTGTFVLLLRWEDDDLGTKAELQDLEEVFREDYHYNTETYLLPSNDPTTQLEYKLNDFRRAYDNGTNLLLLYYGGHGFLDHKRPSRSIWQAHGNGGATLAWSDLQGVLERAKSDVVFILDCCFAASASRCAASKEGLWACNSEVTTTGVNDNSFTRNLIQELKSLKTDRFNIAMLHARLMKRYRKPGPHMLLTEPWYTYLGDVALPSTELIPQSPRQMSSASSAPIAQVQPSTESPAVVPLTVDQSMTETLVLLAVRLKDAGRMPDLSSWQNWCHDLAPDNVGSVHALGRIQVRDLVSIEAHYLSNSALILVSMPIFIWDRLPSIPSISFVSFIKSANLLFPARNPQLEIFFNQSIEKQDWARVKTIEERSEPDADYIFRDGQHDDLQLKTEIAIARASQGEWKEAEELLGQVVETRRKVLGAEHPHTLTSLNNLAMAYAAQGRWTEAKELEMAVIITRNKVLGAEHPSTLISCGNLASVHRAQGQYQEAEKLGVRVMETFQRVLGVDDPSTLNSCANLALTYSAQGRWEAAEELGVRVMDTRKKVLGARHPDTLTSIANLAATFWYQGRLEEAAVLAVHVMDVRTDVLGAEHPDTLQSVANLALTYKNQGRLREAEELEMHVVKSRKRVLGNEHPFTLMSMANLASLLNAQGKFAQAEQMYRQTIALRERVMGEENPSTLASMYGLAEVLKTEGKYKEAETIHRQILTSRERVEGKEHPHTLASMDKLASVLSVQGRYDEAKEIRRQEVALMEIKLGSEHLDTLTSMSNLALILAHQGKYEEAELIHRKVLAGRQRQLGKEHPSTLASMNNLALLLNSK